jgi:hypothetical protein
VPADFSSGTVRTAGLLVKSSAYFLPSEAMSIVHTAL